MKKVLAIVLALAMIFSLAACGEQEEAADGKVYWLNRNSGMDEVLQDIAATYSAKTGIEVNVVTPEEGTYEATLAAALDGENAPTLFEFAGMSQAESFADNCFDLKGSKIATELSTDAYNVYDADSKLCAIAYSYDCGGIIVNKSLLSKSGHSLEEIYDFESLKTVAEDIHARSKDLGCDAFASCALDAASSFRFTKYLANMPLYYESVDNRWEIQPSGIEGSYLDNFKAAWDLMMNNSSASKSALAGGKLNPQSEFIKSEAVFFIGTSDDFEACSAMGRDNLAMIPIYCGVHGEENSGLCCGAENLWAVNSKAPKADVNATIDFMYWLVTSPEGTALFAEYFGGVPYKAAVESNNVFFNDCAAFDAAGRYTVTMASDYAPNADTWRDGLASALSQYAGGSGWDTVVKAFVDAWSIQYSVQHEPKAE